VGSARGHGVGEGMVSREAVALGGGRPGTPGVHAQVLSMRECKGENRPGVGPCAVAHRRSPRWSPTGDALDLPHSSGFLQAS